MSKPKQVTELLYLGPTEDFFSNVVAGFHNPVTIQLQSYNWTFKQQEIGVHTHTLNCCTALLNTAFPPGNADIETPVLLQHYISFLLKKKKVEQHF